MTSTLIDYFKKTASLLWSLFSWLCPLALFLLAIYIPKIFWDLKFQEYIDFLKILIWPYTILIILFFFKKVVTYLFFSMDEFNFFGAKGNLKNVNEVILEEVEKKFLEKENEERRKTDIENLNTEIKKKEEALSNAKGTAEENLKLANEIMAEWKKSNKKNADDIRDLEAKNLRLKEIISELTTAAPEVNSISNTDDQKTSDPIKDESNTN
jgi:hypothetical protein